MGGDIPPPRFGHSFTMVSKTKAVLFGGAVSVAGTGIVNQENTSLRMRHSSMIFKLQFGKS